MNRFAPPALALALFSAVFPARASADAPLVRGLVLDGSAYTLCAVTARSRDACLEEGGAPGAGAVDELGLAAHAPGVDHVVVFLSGYRTRYDRTATIAARLARLFGPRFLVVFADWGSHGMAVGYRADELAARRNTPAFAGLIADLHRAIPDRAINVFAHSMGARVAAGAMASCASAADGSHLVDEAVFAAPDLALPDYQRAITRTPEPVGHVTIYTSRDDRALAASELMHLHHRLGQVALWRHMIAHTDVVDASAADHVADGHGYAIHDPRVMHDIESVLLDAPVPHPGWTRGNGMPWILDPEKSVAG